MNIITRRVNELTSQPWFITLGTAASIASFIWLLYDKLVTQGPGVLPIVAFTVSLAVFTITHTYSIWIHKENQALKEIGHFMHQVNHSYRDTLARLFAGNDPETDGDTLLFEEKATLKLICQQISDLFTRLTGGTSPPCIVTVKLLKHNRHGKLVAVTHVRSHDTNRDEEDPKEYEVGNKENIAFDVALVPRPVGECSHFFSPDLKQLGEYYRNQRQSWRRHYKSAIVVPIRCLDRSRLATGQPASDDLGFLAVDSQTKNRLNGYEHVELLSGFADQMYNFMSLMRGKYNVLVTSPQEQ